MTLSYFIIFECICNDPPASNDDDDDDVIAGDCVEDWTRLTWVKEQQRETGENTYTSIKSTSNSFPSRSTI